MRKCADCGTFHGTGSSSWCPKVNKNLLLWAPNEAVLSRPRKIKKPQPYSWSKKRRIVLAGDPLCYLCGVAIATTIDHVIPKSRGGTNDLSNLAPACSPCNSAKGNAMPTHTEEEWYVSCAEGMLGPYKSAEAAVRARDGISACPLEHRIIHLLNVRPHRFEWRRSENDPEEDTP